MPSHSSRLPPPRLPVAKMRCPSCSLFKKTGTNLAEPETGHFKLYNSVAFHMFAELRNRPRCPVPRPFHHPRENFVPVQQSKLWGLQPLAAARLLPALGPCRWPCAVVPLCAGSLHRCAPALPGGSRCLSPVTASWFPGCPSRGDHRSPGSPLPCG